MSNPWEALDWIIELRRAIHDRDKIILDTLRACQLGLEAARDNYTGTEGWVGFGKYVCPILETAITRAEKCLNG